MSWDFLNLFDPKSVYQSRQLTDDRTELKDDWNFGDSARWLGAAILGEGDQFTREAVLENAQKYRTEKLNDQLRNERLKARQLGGIIPGVDVSERALKAQDGEKGSDTLARLQQLQLVGQAAQEALITNPNLSSQLSQLGPGATVSTVNALRAADTQRQIDEKKRKTENREQLEIDRYNRNEQRESDRYYDLQKQRLLERQDQRQANNRQYELQIMALQSADKNRMQDRKDRRMMQLLAGLSNLGEAFTV